MKFKKGDKVRCLESRFGNETVGKVYTVAEHRSKKDAGDAHAGLDLEIERDDNGHRNSYESKYFKLASSDSNEPLTSLPPDAPGMVASSTGGLRDNKGKPRLSLVPRQLEEGVAEVIWKSSVQGGGKYPLHNWRKGLPFTEVADSCMRHIKKWVDGEDVDAETGLHHLKHAACNLAFLLWYIVFRPNMDDRFKGDSK